jgi:hypothetical protein
MSALNPDGSHASQGVHDNTSLPLNAGPSQPLNEDRSMLLNPGTDGGDDRAPSPVPMHAYGFEGSGDPLFSLEPNEKG